MLETKKSYTAVRVAGEEIEVAMLRDQEELVNCDCGKEHEKTLPTGSEVARLKNLTHSESLSENFLTNALSEKLGKQVTVHFPQ